jgi:hypothetical protein
MLLLGGRLSTIGLNLGPFGLARPEGPATDPLLGHDSMSM